MYYALTQREALLGYLPPGATGAEIGVAEGAFSAAILQAANPRELHLIDPWSHLEPGSNPFDASQHLAGIEAARLTGEVFAPPPENRAGDAIFEAVTVRFAGDKRVPLHRQYSYKAASGFAPGSLDFAYLDGNHHYEFVLQDLQDFGEKLTPGGLLFGHDYFEDDFARSERYGVIDAVTVFLKRSDFRMFLLTWEPFSTFCLARNLEGFAGQFLRNILDSGIDMIELPDAIAGNYRDIVHRRADGSAKRIPSFAPPRGPNPS